jgi:hypothetical protein
VVDSGAEPECGRDVAATDLVPASGAYAAPVTTKPRFKLYGCQVVKRTEKLLFYGEAPLGNLARKIQVTKWRFKEEIFKRKMK